MPFNDLSLTLLLVTLALAGLTILVCGIRMTGLADRIADRTGLGEALIGGVLLGAATSLSGSVVSVTAALDGRASLAFSNGVGGIAAQTAFLALADILHRRANLEHAAAELANVFQGALLVLLLTIPIIAYAGPDVTIFGVHPGSFILLLVYGVGVVASKRVREDPMWRPVGTSMTEKDSPDEEESDNRGNIRLFVVFGVLMLIMGVAGWMVAKVANELTDRYDLSASLVGALMTAIVTSLPELVTTLAAVRRGALQLAVGGIIGGNTFDTLFLTFSDVSFRDGSIYHALERPDFFWLATGLAMTSVLLLGLIVRQRAGPGGIGFESMGILGIYLMAIGVQAFAM
jgi:cation:H+ antiporter